MRTPRLEGLTDWRPLARGGFAVVWEARQESLDRLVAVKIITRRLDNPEERARFLRESGAAGRMSSHPGIVTVHDAGLLDDDRPYLVMELCTGGSLTRLLQPENRPDPGWVRDLGVRIADALDAAHAQGVLHRDVKPANVLIDAYGHAGLADFGLAVMTDPGMDLEERLEALTPAYAPPEAFAPHSPTRSGDVYSLAATLYALLCGHAPRAVDPSDADPDLTAAQVVMAHLDDPVERLPDIDPQLMDVLMEALDDEPGRRPSAAAFRDALAALDLGAPTARPGPRARRAGARPRAGGRGRGDRGGRHVRRQRRGRPGRRPPSPSPSRRSCSPRPRSSCCSSSPRSRSPGAGRRSRPTRARPSRAPPPAPAGPRRRRRAPRPRCSPASPTAPPRSGAPRSAGPSRPSAGAGWPRRSTRPTWPARRAATARTSTRRSRRRSRPDRSCASPSSTTTRPPRPCAAARWSTRCCPRPSVAATGRSTPSRRRPPTTGRRSGACSGVGSAPRPVELTRPG